MQTTLFAFLSLIATIYAVSLPYTIRNGVIPDNIGTGASDGSNLYLATFTDPMRIIKYRQSDMTRLATINLTISQGATFAEKSCINMKNTFLYVFGYRYTNYAGKQIGGPNEANGGSNHFGPPVIVKVNISNGSFSVVSVKPVAIVDTDYSVTKMFADLNYVYVVITDFHVYRFLATDLSYQGKINLQDCSFVRLGVDVTPGALATDKIAYFFNGHIVKRLRLKTFTTLPQIALTYTVPYIRDPMIVGNYMYFATVVTINGKQQGQAVRFNIANNFTQDSVTNVGPSYDGFDNRINFAYDLFSSTKIYALQFYIDFYTDKTTFSEYQVYGITLSNNAVTTTLNDPLPDTNLVYGTESFYPEPAFFLVANGNAFYASASNNLYKVNLATQTTPTKIAIQGLTNGDATHFVIRGNKLVYFDALALGTLDLVTGVQAYYKGTDIHSFQTTASYVDTTGSYAYVVDITGFLIQKFRLDNTSITKSATKQAPSSIFATYQSGNNVQFFCFGTNTLTIWDYTTNTIVHHKDVTSFDFQEINYATIDTTNSSVYFSSYTGSGTKAIFKWDFLASTVSTFYQIPGPINYQSVQRPFVFGNYVYITTGGLLYRFDKSTKNLLGTISSTGGLDHSTVITSADGAYLYWAQGNAISKINAASFTIVESTDPSTRVAFNQLAEGPEGKIYFGGAVSNYFGNIIFPTGERTISNIGVI
jgi:hypothetical protein